MGNGTVASLGAIEERFRSTFEKERRVLSFGEYLGLVRAEPTRHVRDAAAYVSDMFLSFGEERREGPFRSQTRYSLFDQAFLGPDAVSERLSGQERVQNEVFRALRNFVRTGRPGRLLLLHGPNGSAKTTFVQCILRGLEHYSEQPEGALYRYSWVFPKKNQVRGAIGFGGAKPAEAHGSYAHFSDDELEARVVVEVREHPLFLLPRDERRALLGEVLPPDFPLPRYLTHGSLCDKSKRIFDALLLDGGGSLEHVLRHVRIERYFISRRYRTGAVTLGPELSVDARERQVTMDQNLGNLPLSLRGVSLYEASGELVDATGGVLEMSDLLKRPLDAFKYLQTMIETGEVALGNQSVQVNCVLLASANEVHLAAFREHPEFESFRGRFELIPVPYLLDPADERAVYAAQVAGKVGMHVAPHALELAARFAVLTRLRRPTPAAYQEQLRPALAELSPWEKLLLYSGKVSEAGSEGARAKRLTQLGPIAAQLAEEYRSDVEFEGSFGASPREMSALLLDAAQDARFAYLSPFAVLDALERLCKRTEDYAFLRIPADPAGFHDTQKFRAEVRVWLLDRLEDEFRQVSGLVEEAQYGELLGRYFEHLGARAKGEKVKNPVTFALEEPDEKLMGHVERLLGSSVSKEDFRARLMGRLAAWGLDNPGVPARESSVFTELLVTLRTAVFQERRGELAAFCVAVRDPADSRQADVRAAAVRGLADLIERFGYTQASAKDAAARLLKERFTDLA